MSYEFKNGVIATRLGEDAPAALHKFLDQVSATEFPPGSMRVQLGPNGSFVVWSEIMWACCNVPDSLRDELVHLSFDSGEINGVTMGYHRIEAITNVQWHMDGSFYIQGLRVHSWSFLANMLHNAWECLWQGLVASKIEDLAELAVSDLNHCDRTASNS
jgi:hypothetical protein